MLVLTRKTGEEIVIAGNIRLSIVEIGPGRVRIGIDAPKSVTIDRAEIHEKKKAEPQAVEVPAFHNRIAANLPPVPDALSTPEAEAAPQMQLENRLKKHQPRLPRKPR